MFWHICQDPQCGQTPPIGPSHTKSHQVTCHLPDIDILRQLSVKRVDSHPEAQVVAYLGITAAQYKLSTHNIRPSLIPIAPHKLSATNCTKT